jgi:hypothetical protein
MGVLAWAMVGLALWHFTIWLPDRSWGGIVGSLLGALIGIAVMYVIGDRRERALEASDIGI